MNITEQQAFVIARALYKGIQQQEKGETKFYFSVWRDGAANIGIKKRRRQRYALFVDFNGREDKSIHFPYFDRNIDLEELSQMVQQAIEESVVLQDKDLDTTREIFRNLPEEAPKEEPSPIDEEDEFIEDTLPEDDGDSDDEFVEDNNDDDEEFEFEEIIEDKSEVVDENHEPVGDFDEIDTESDEDPFAEAAPKTIVNTSANKNTNQGFDISYYLCNTAVPGTIMEKSKRIAVKVSEFMGDEDRQLKGALKSSFINFLDAVIQANMFTSMTNEECTMRYDNLYMKDIFDFLMNNDLTQIDAKFSTLPKDHLALIPYKVYAVATPDIKSQVMQSAVLKLANYSTDDFNNIFDDIVEEIKAAEEQAQQILEEDTMKETETINVDELVGNTDLVDEHGEPNAYSALAPAEESQSAVSTEVRSMSLLQGQINERAEEFAQGMNNVFLEIVKSKPDQAEILYFIAMEIALETYNGDAKALAEKIKSDPRDIIMADYEFKTRIQAKDLNDLKHR